jgi:hypothetical protein
MVPVLQFAQSAPVHVDLEARYCPKETTLPIPAWLLFFLKFNATVSLVCGLLHAWVGLKRVWFCCFDFVHDFRIPYSPGSGWVLSFEKYPASGSACIDTNYTNYDTGTVPIPTHLNRLVVIIALHIRKYISTYLSILHVITTLSVSILQRWIAIIYTYTCKSFNATIEWDPL